MAEHDFRKIDELVERGSGPKNLLVHNFWAFGMLRKLIEAACARAGIKVVPVEPRGSYLSPSTSTSRRRRSTGNWPSPWGCPQLRWRKG